ncbi:hypothetical protein K7X08_009133 [Anisodus acutangulus]|uniref:ZF-HD dimerization-type domain-containing protein n=1 Tax=Anisodus acutangulus TaxID=402998 RepID=A0A9Q1MYQ3_9SOLA|nr:hypothetical protein K7X08_009133 [Anisodus acutangulus]
MASNNKNFVKYFECMHNYAARSMGHVLDGCGEFCPTGAPGTPESFICAACHCHRNFHRKVEEEVEVAVELPVYAPKQISSSLNSFKVFWVLHLPTNKNVWRGCCCCCSRC